MDGNSMRCKQYCVALQTVLLGFTYKDSSWNVVLCVVVLSLLFSVMDAGYLAFSRHFRKQQMNFVVGVDTLSDYEEKIFYVVTLKGHERVCEMIRAFLSMYVWPFYLCGGIVAFCLNANK